jgi:CheY-like chemotaxis protein
LAISKALVEMMGGDLNVVAEVGQGSSFHARLPLMALRIAPAEKQSAPPLRFEGRRVLVVDDNEVNLLVSSHVIEKFGCQAVCAHSGPEALSLLLNEQFDLVFMDVKMPVMTGLEVTQEIRRREGDDLHTPVIALTAGALLQEQQACFDAGMDDFVTKPISIDSIQNILNKWLPQA